MAAYVPIQQICDPQPIRATCFSPDGQVYIVGTNSKALKICKYPSLDLRENLINQFKHKTNPLESELPEPDIAFTCLHIHCASVYCATFDKSGSLYATGSNDRTVHLTRYDPKLQSPQGSEYKFSTHSGSVRDVCFVGEDSTCLVSAGGGEFEINVTDCCSMKRTQVYHGHESTVMSLHQCDKLSQTFISGSLDGTIRLWDLRCRTPVSIVTVPKVSVEHNSSMQTCSHSSGDSIQVQHNEPTNVSPLEEKRPDNKQQQEQQVQPALGLPVGAVRIDPTGRLLASGLQNGSCMLYDIRCGKIIQQFGAHKNEIRTLNFSPNSYYLLTASYDHTVKLMDLQGNLDQKLPSAQVAELPDKVVQAAWHPVDYNFVTTCANGTATLWAIPDSVTMNDSFDCSQSTPNES